MASSLTYIGGPTALLAAVYRPATGVVVGPFGVARAGRMAHYPTNPVP